MLRKHKKINKNKFLIIFIMIGVCSGILISSNFIFSEKAPKDTSKVLNSIEEVVQVSTTKYTYSDIVTVTKEKSFKNIKIPFSEKSFIIKYNGIIKGGADFTEIKILDNDRSSISLEVGELSIVDHYVDDENVYVYDIKNSIFNKVDVNEVLEELSKNKKQYEAKVIEEGFMEEVKSNTKKSLENSLINLGYEEVNITFKE
ncbi:MAG: DUF4230 domain-containing protein [Paraclostridium sp.]